MNRRKKSSRPIAVALMSGGMDSCVAAAIAKKTHEVTGLYASYGQRTDRREKRAFTEITARMGIKKTLMLDLKFLKQMGGSSLTDTSMPVPEGKTVRGIPSTYVPFRNGVLLAAAIAWAETIGARAVYIGAVAPDAPQGYPDTSPDFFTAFEKAAQIGTRPETRIRIVAPLAGMDKTAVVRTGIKLNAPFELTWSCYREERIACGKCLSCTGRIKAFKNEGLEDPIKYKTKRAVR